MKYLTAILLAAGLYGHAQPQTLLPLRRQNFGLLSENIHYIAPSLACIGDGARVLAYTGSRFNSLPGFRGVSTHNAGLYGSGYLKKSYDANIKLVGGLGLYYDYNGPLISDSRLAPALALHLEFWNNSVFSFGISADLASRNVPGALKRHSNGGVFGASYRYVRESVARFQVAASVGTSWEKGQDFDNPLDFNVTAGYKHPINDKNFLNLLGSATYLASKYFDHTFEGALSADFEHLADEDSAKGFKFGGTLGLNRYGFQNTIGGYLGGTLPFGLSFMASYSYPINKGSTLALHTVEVFLKYNLKKTIKSFPKKPYR